MESNYPKKRLMELTNESRVAITRHYEEQRLEFSTNENFPKRKERIYPKIKSTQHGWISSFSQAMVTVQMNQERRNMATSRYHTEKRMECSAAR